MRIGERRSIVVLLGVSSVLSQTLSSVPDVHEIVKSSTAAPSVTGRRQVPKAFDFQLVGEDVVGGWQAYVLQATPHPGYQSQGKYGKIFSKVEGKLWVDKQDLGWIKVDAQVIQPFSMGFFLARVQRGSHITMEQARVDKGIWVPEHIEVRAAAKIFFIKNLVIEQVLTYSEYRLPQAAATMMVR